MRILELFLLVICERTWHQDATSGCVQNMKNTMVFVRFTVFRKFEFPVSRGRIWASFWEAFGDHRITFPRFLEYQKDVGI